MRRNKYNRGTSTLNRNRTSRPRRPTMVNLCYLEKGIKLAQKALHNACIGASSASGQEREVLDVGMSNEEQTAVENPGCL